MAFNPPTQDGSRNYQGRVTNYSWEFTGSMWPQPGAVSISQILLYLASEGTRREKPQNTHGRFRQLTQNPPMATVKSVNIQRSVATFTSRNTWRWGGQSHSCQKFQESELLIRFNLGVKQNGRKISVIWERKLYPICIDSAQSTLCHNEEDVKSNLGKPFQANITLDLQHACPQGLCS